MPVHDQRARSAVPADIASMISADHLAVAGDAARIRYLERVATEGECLIEVDDSGCAGFVVTRPAHFFGRDFIDIVMVHPRRRRSGVGRRLLRSAVDAAATDKVFTSTNRSNMAMRELLDREDWTFSGELTGLDEGDPELVCFVDRA